MPERIDSKAAFFVMGIAVGSLIAILFAPKSGEETREYLAHKAKEGRKLARNKARELTDQAEELMDRGNEVVARKQEQIATAIDAGRKAFRRVKGKARVA